MTNENEKRKETIRDLMRAAEFKSECDISRNEYLREVNQELRILNRLLAIYINSTISIPAMGSDYGFLINMQKRPIEPDV